MTLNSFGQPVQSICKVATSHPDRESRCGALRKLSHYIEQPKINNFLRRRAIKDDYWHARAISLRVLSLCTDKSCCDFIVERVDDDADYRVRAEALEIIVEIWPLSTEDLFLLLENWCKNSVYPSVRFQALTILVEKYSSVDTMITILLERATNDQDPVVRLSAVEALVNRWRSDQGVYYFLIEKAKNDIDPDVRRAANRVALPAVSIFVSYSHKDATQAKLLIDYICEELSRDGVDIWWDEKLNTGDYWDNEIRTKIRESHIGLVLISQPFLNSKYCQSVEIRNFLRQRRSDGMVIFPIIVSACAWQNYDWLRETQALPLGGKNWKSHYKNPGKREELFFRTLSHLQQIVREIRQAEQQ